MVIRILASAPSSAAKVAVDPWIPLSVVWDVEPNISPLYLFVRDPRQGYVELKVHPESGALVGMVVIDLPRQDESARQLRGQTAPMRSETVVLDLEIWPWNVTPDYREPARHDIDVLCSLSVARTSDQMTIWFSKLPVVRVVKAGPVEIGVAMGGELVAIMVSGTSVAVDSDGEG